MSEQEIEAIGVEVATLPIELYKVLKIANAVSGGGEAKHAIGEGYVWVNGEVEQRKRRKIEENDVIFFNEEYYVVLFNPDSVVVEPSAPKPPKPKNKPKNTAPKPKKAKTDKTTGRPRLMF